MIILRYRFFIKVKISKFAVNFSPISYLPIIAQKSRDRSILRAVTICVSNVTNASLRHSMVPNAL